MCAGACETISSGQADYLIVGTELSEQYIDKQVNLKNYVKKCTDFQEDAKVITEDQLKKLVATCNNMEENHVDVLRFMKYGH